jgi:hypothetical protein
MAAGVTPLIPSRRLAEGTLPDETFSGIQAIADYLAALDSFALVYANTEWLAARDPYLAAEVRAAYTAVFGCLPRTFFFCVTVLYVHSAANDSHTACE